MTILGIDTSLRSTGYGVVATEGSRLSARAYGNIPGTLLVLGEARGAVLAAAANAGVPVYEYEPRRMKKAICGNGLAEKDQIQRMVKVLLNLPEIPQNDAADALGMAICHTHSAGPFSQDRPI